VKAIIIGAGIGGLTAGIALRQSGQEVAVFERESDLRPAGAGISLWSNGVKVLASLGLGDRLAAAGGRMDRMAYCSAQGTVLTCFSLVPLYERVGARAYPVSRAELQRLLLSALGADVRLDSECVEVAHGRHGTVTAVFADGYAESADLLVAADGTHSRLRAEVIGYDSPRRPVGYVNWNGIVPTDAVGSPPGTWVTYVGDGKRVALMPVGGDRSYFFFDVPYQRGADPPQGGPGPHFRGWADPVQRLLSVLPEGSTNRVVIHDHDPLPTFVRDRVVLLGDAAHTTAPDLGQGGCQAMEDAVVLAASLRGTGPDVSAALHQYDQLRVERAAEVIGLARRRAEMTHGADRRRTARWYEELADENGSHVMDGMARTIQGGPCG
jgi:FAD-dependent urate hydroxylase